MKESSSPHSAISSWSGFIYQGKIALYHALKLIVSKKHNENFEVQLDSTDDFAIYVDKDAVSAHQVKAKSSNYRSEYEEALIKSAIIEHDRTSLTKRYFHTSSLVDDFTDYQDSNGIVVKFYKYDDSSFCPLSSIEEKSKNLLKELLDTKAIAYSNQIIDHNYALLSESISKKVIYIHALNQNHGKPIRQAAYENRIHCQNILTIATNIAIENDNEYAAVKLRSTFSSILDLYIIENIEHYSDLEAKRLRATFEHLYSLENFQLEKLCHLIQPSESLPVIPHKDVEAYADLICEFIIDPSLSGIPHYINSDNKFYVPTAIDLPNPKRAKTFQTRLMMAIEQNNKLPTLLFEYNNLIAAQCENIIEISTLPSTIGSLPEDDPDLITPPNTDNNIIRKLQVKILSKVEAERELHAK